MVKELECAHYYCFQNTKWTNVLYKYIILLDSMNALRRCNLFALNKLNQGINLT